MSNDISSMYTKDQNKKAGRRGYSSWKHEKVLINISQMSLTAWEKQKKN